MYDTKPRTRRRYCPTSIAVAAVAALAMMVADAAGSEWGFHAGLTLFLLAATTLITVRTGVNTEILEAARQRGWDEGYKAGRTVARPVVVRKVG